VNHPERPGHPVRAFLHVFKPQPKKELSSIPRDRIWIASDNVVRDGELGSCFSMSTGANSAKRSSTPTCHGGLVPDRGDKGTRYVSPRIAAIGMLSLHLSSVDTTIIQRLYRGIAAFLGRPQSHHVVRKLRDDCARVRMYREDINVASAITTLLPKRGDRSPGYPGCFREVRLRNQFGSPHEHRRFLLGRVLITAWTTPHRCPPGVERMKHGVLPASTLRMRIP
jgi:hypothetical protein